MDLYSAILSITMNVKKIRLCLAMKCSKLWRLLIVSWKGRKTRRLCLNMGYSEKSDGVARFPPEGRSVELGMLATCPELSGHTRRSHCW